MSSVVFYSYNMSKNFLLVCSTSAHPNGSSVFCFSASSNVVSNQLSVNRYWLTVCRYHYFNLYQTFRLIVS